MLEQHDNSTFKFRCTANLRLRTRPTTESETIMVMAKDSIQTAVGVDGDWYKVMTKWNDEPYAGFCYSGYCEKVEEAISKPTTGDRGSSSVNVSSTHMPQIDIPNGSLTKDQITAITWEYFMSEGLSKNVAAAIMGNIELESGFDVNAVGGKGLCFGLCQWAGGRYDNLKTKARRMGKTPSALAVQLAHLMDELSGTEMTFINKISYRYGSVEKFKISEAPIATLTKDFMETFERPSSNPEINHIYKRIESAEGYYTKYSNNN